MITNHLSPCTSVKILWLGERQFAEKGRGSFVLVAVWAEGTTYGLGAQTWKIAWPICEVFCVDKNTVYCTS